MKGVGPEGGAELEEPGGWQGPSHRQPHCTTAAGLLSERGRRVFSIPELILFPSWPQIYPEKTLVFVLAEV